MCEHNLTSKDLEVILDMFEEKQDCNGLDDHEIHVQTKVKKLYAWSLL